MTWKLIPNCSRSLRWELTKLECLLSSGYLSYVFLYVTELLGNKGQNWTEKPVRVAGYRVDDIEYYVATNQFDLNA